MIWRIFRRFLTTLLVVFLVVSLTFFMLHRIPGGPFDQERPLPEEVLDQLDNYYGQDLSLSQQYGHYLKHILRGDFGPSYFYSAWSVNELVGKKVLVSVELGFYALIIAIVLGLLWGTYLSLSPGRRWDRFSVTMTTFWLCVPSFVIASIGSYLFSCRLGWLPAMGWWGIGTKILPVSSLALVYLCMITRLTRKSMQQEWSRLYVRTARSKGLSAAYILWHHVFLNGVQPVIAYLGPTCAGVLSGTFAIESIFNIPGLGRLFVESIGNRDYPVISGIVILYSLFICFGSFIADCLLLAINPKLRD